MARTSSENHYSHSSHFSLFGKIHWQGQYGPEGPAGSTPPANPPSGKLERIGLAGDRSRTIASQLSAG
jgi:hypothetical protein